MGPLKTARRYKEPFKYDLILVKFIFFLMNLAKIKSCLNGSSDRRAVLSGPMAFDPIHSHKYFHICIYFIHQVIACFSKHAARAIATLQCSNCNKHGHLKADCWAKGGSKEGQGLKRKDKAQDSAATVEENELGAWAAVEEVSAEEDQGDFVGAAGSPLVRPGRAHDAATKLYDSGASRHMSPFRDRFQTYQAIEPRAISAANKRIFYAIGTGDLRIEVPHGESSTPIILKDVLHAPEMGLTIVSIDRICKAGNSVMFKDDICTIKNKDNKVIGIIPASANRLYKVKHVHMAMVALECVDSV